MNIWKPANKKSKKLSNEVPSDAGAALPDVIAGLSYGDSGHEVMSEGAMIGYSSYYTDTQEIRGRRREPRSHNAIAPQGIGATQGEYLPSPPHELGVVPSPPQGDTTRRSEQWPSQRGLHSDYNWNQSVLLSPSGVPEVTGGSYGCSLGVVYTSCHGGGEIVGARVRSMSSEPHGHPSNRSVGDRRTRCSSATRNRQSRTRPSNSNLEDQLSYHQHPSASPTLRCSVSHQNAHSSPSTSPAVQRIEYQQTSTAPVPTMDSGRVNSANVQGENSNINEFQEEHRNPLPEPLPSTSRSEDINVLGGGSYGYQVPDLEALLTQASPTRPANLPMVLASSTRLHNMRRSQENQTRQASNTQLPVRPILPLGIIVNAVFKTRDWLYVRTAHGAEGYVPYRVCLPLGILPPSRRSPPNSSNDGLLSGATGPWELRGGVDYRGASSSNQVAPRIFISKSQSTTTFSSDNFNGQTSQSHPRGRHRGRRRLNAENTNQTDLQKLQPSTTRNTTENIVLPRETLNPSSMGNSSNVL